MRMCVKFLDDDLNLAAFELFVTCMCVNVSGSVHLSFFVLSVIYTTRSSLFLCIMRHVYKTFISVCIMYMCISCLCNRYQGFRAKHKHIGAEEFITVTVTVIVMV
jgi:hypothetical protein